MENTDRRLKHRRKLRRRRILIVLAIVAIFAAYARNIVKLEIENRRLISENESLTELRDKLKIELKNVNSREYIEDRARQQLRLVSPDEILFVFPKDDPVDKAKDKDEDKDED